MKDTSTCPACNSDYAVYIQDVVGYRTSNLYPQYFCMDCQSFFHVSGYRETEEQKISDFQFLYNDRDNHYALQNQLALELITKLPGTQSVLEVGHGAGFFLKSCKDYNLRAVGFEVNRHCHEFAKNHLGVDSRLDYFDESHKDKYDLIASIQVFEHLEKPRELFKIMRDHLNRDGAIYLSVPFVERNQWKFLWNAGELGGKHYADVLANNDVHIMNFSIEGMKRMGISLGARTAEYFVSQDVHQKSPGAYQGVLFRF